ncbi:GAF domain-containing sensor histidine kinase [Mycobacterium sp. LTG2003]
MHRIGPITGREGGEVRDLAAIQSSLRRLATLIAQGVHPDVVFSAVTREVLHHFGRGTARLIRYELDGSATVLANEGTAGPHVRVGERWEGYPPTGLTEVVRTTGRPARVDDYRHVPGGEPYVREGLLSAVGMPIHVHGRLWGMIAVGSGAGPLPGDTEQRMSEFTDLVATAVASAQSRAELEFLRHRMATTSYEVSRRIERDLHDGVQQRLVALVLRLRTASETGSTEQLREEAAAAAIELTDVMNDLREISRGVHPATLSLGGLPSALRDLGRRSVVPVDVDVRIPRRLAEEVEVAVYYTVAEMLTNAAKHAQASEMWVSAETGQRVLRLRVRDDGVGGADPMRGTGLRGLRDRIEALGGTFELDSRPGRGTMLSCEIPTAAAR